MTPRYLVVAGSLRPGLSGVHEPGVVLNHDLSADVVRALGHDPQERLDVGESEGRARHR